MSRSRRNLCSHFPPEGISRRDWLKSTLLGSGAGAVLGGFPSAMFGADSVSKYEGPVVETGSGKVCGVISGGTHVFRGIPYGVSTAGNRAA